LEENPQILHFWGHGDINGIIIEDEYGESKTLSSNSIDSLFKLFSNTIECVILNACFSENQARDISKYIPFVIGMNDSIGDKTAIVFATSFYDAIGDGKNIEFAFKYGISNLSLEDLEGQNIPVLFKK
jgi:hypothetical protein